MAFGNDDMKQNTHSVMAVTWFVAQAMLFLLGGLNVLFGIVCYLGGPDPRPGDLHLHLIFGTLWSGVGIALVLGGRKAGRVAGNHWKSARAVSNTTSDGIRQSADGLTKPSV